MKRFHPWLFLALALQAGLAHGDIVIRAVPDTLPGKSLGGLSGFMIGAVTGPIGAAVGAGLGWFGGGHAQESAGLGTAYLVRRDDGTETVVRSPNRTWAPGDTVRIVRGRLVAEEKADKLTVSSR
jgi:outer membrane lipoprotein SlyB